ncbi:MAG: hypothetical protein AAGJ52_10835, partial [Pseudomonadota bacterium]
MNTSARRAAEAAEMPDWLQQVEATGGSIPIMVNVLAGDDDGSCGTDAGDPLQDCSLLEAVALANSDSDASVIEFEVSGAIAVNAPVVLLETVHLDGSSAPGGTGSVFIDGQDLIPNVLSVSGGDGSVIEGLVIGQSASSGLLVAAPASNVMIVGNFIGTNAAGDDLANDQVTIGTGGILVAGAVGTTIGGLTGQASNTVGFSRTGILLADGTSNSVVVGNYVGTNSSGADLGNSLAGFFIIGADNTIGGTVAGAENIVGFNDQVGVVVSSDGATGNVIEGNLIGIDAVGSALGNVGPALQVQDASNNVIGGTAPGASNRVGFNVSGLILLGDTGQSLGNVIQGNEIGTDAGGTNFGNQGAGILIQDASGSLIGGTMPGAGNIIGFNGTGIGLVGIDTAASGNEIVGNYIGTNAAGDNLGNVANGILIQRASNNTIGCLEQSACNIIGFSGQNGIQIADRVSGEVGNRLINNYIGTNPGGDDLGNGGNGIYLLNSGDNR